MDRRKFFGMAAATTSTALLEPRSFARSFEDRHAEIKGTDLTFVFYYGGKEVHRFTAPVRTKTVGNTLHLGSLQLVSVPNPPEIFDELRAEIYPEVGADITPPDVPIAVGPNDNLSLQGNVDGFMTIGG